MNARGRPGSKNEGVLGRLVGEAIPPVIVVNPEPQHLSKNPPATPRCPSLTRRSLFLEDLLLAVRHGAEVDIVFPAILDSITRLGYVKPGHINFTTLYAMPPIRHSS